MCNPILSLTSNSIENATPSSGTSPLASYKEVPPPPLPGNKEECQMMFKHRLPLCHQRGILLCLLYVLVSLSLNVLLRYLDNKITCFFCF